MQNLIKTTLLFTAIVWLTGASDALAQNNYTIPDANFAAWLTANIPSAMSSGNLMDTTSAAVTTRTRIDVENLGIANLSGIQYFTSLITLDCGNGFNSPFPNALTSLPNLPATLDSLICGNNQLTILPTLPITLTFLKCYGNQLTSLPSLPGSLTNLQCSNNQLTSLPALPGSLINLNCYHNQLTSLPALPVSLTNLQCSSNQLTGFSSLPNQLTFIDCSNNQLWSIPALPTNLDTLYCYYNNLTSLPTLPGSLTLFDCSTNQITSLPNLPGSLLILQCNNNNLTSLPALPGSLTHLICGENQLTVLPVLPASLIVLAFRFGQITQIPILPAGLITLDCSVNQITNLPSLPASLQILNCEGNQLTSIPALPGGLLWLFCNWNYQLTTLPALPNTLQFFKCDSCNISCFPVLPNSIQSGLFSIAGNPFSCLPNYIPAMNAGTLAYPLCLPGNSNGCSASVGIVGFTFKDLNSDCARNTGDQNLVNIPMKIYDSSNNLLRQTYTATNGVYNFSDTANTYKVSVDTTGMPFIAQCTFPGLDTIVTLVSLDTNVNFSLTCKPGFDVGVQSVVNTNGLVFPGQTHHLSVVAGDMTQWYNLNCASGISGTVQISVLGPVTYVSPGAGALTPSVAGNIYTYTIADFAAITNDSAFNLVFATDTSAQAGNQICVNVIVTPGADNNMNNNTYSYCYPVVNSHDPNVKEVYPVNVLPAYDGWFTYTIHFQNTGNASAINIRLTDVLDANLNLSTFQVINYSHPNTISLSGNLLTIRYPNINLADSTSDLAHSVGFIQYRIKPNANLPLGTLIHNTANIFFDFNTAVVTNTTVNEFTATASVLEFKKSTASISVYPNPFSSTTTFVIKSFQINVTYSFEMFDVLGKNVKSVQGISSKEFQISRNDLQNGVYFYKIRSAESIISIGKLVIQ